MSEATRDINESRSRDYESNGVKVRTYDILAARSSTSALGKEAMGAAQPQRGTLE